MSILVSASTNPPKECELMQYIADLAKTEVDYIHCDIMDGKFVPNKTLNHKIVGKIHKLTSKPLDVHLMVQKPWRVACKYIKNGASIVSVHFEAFDNSKLLVKTLQKIQKMGAFASLAINPTTAVGEIEQFLPLCDMVLVMSVQPGKSGQKFLPETLQKISLLHQAADRQKANFVVEVDGGVMPDIASTLAKNKVNVVVMGNALFLSTNRPQTIESVHQL